MPRFDGTGPLGTGAIGWGLGPCGAGKGYGRRSTGRGQGFGWRRFWGYYPAPTATSKKEETQILSEEAAALEDELKAIKARLSAIKGKN